MLSRMILSRAAMRVGGVDVHRYATFTCALRRFFKLVVAPLR